MIAGPGQHESVDLWLLLLLAGLGGKRCEAVHKLLKKKFTEGHVDNSWLDRGTVGHQVCSAASLSHLASVGMEPRSSRTAGGASAAVTIAPMHCLAEYGS